MNAKYADYSGKMFAVHLPDLTIGREQTHRLLTISATIHIADQTIYEKQQRGQFLITPVFNTTLYLREIASQKPLPYPQNNESGKTVSDNARWTAMQAANI